MSITTYLQIVVITVITLIALVSVLSSCTISIKFQNISTNGRAEDLVDTDEKTTNTPNLDIKVPFTK